MTAERKAAADGWISAGEAAARLGIKPASLYSYVSRGVLRRRAAPDGRASLFDPAEVESLARRGRPRRAAGGEQFVIESALTEIAGDRLRYRGRDALTLARSMSLEEAAGLLWTGDPHAAAAAPWQAAGPALRAAAAAQGALPEETLPLERLQVIVPALAAADPLRLQLDPPAVIAAGQTIMAGMVDCLPAAAAPRQPHRQDAVPASGPGSLAARLWPKLCPAPPAGGLPAVLQSALVLLADHELAASTFAARVAASVRADPYAVVATGLGAVGGALHGGASLGAESMLGAARTPADVPRVVGTLLRRGERIPGFGHFVYTGGDPRAAFLLEAVRAAAPAPGRLAVADALLAEMRRRGLPAPNIDFALAVLADAAGMVSGAGEAVFAIARTAGWIGHALEEYARRTPLRPRARYTGPRGGDYGN